MNHADNFSAEYFKEAFEVHIAKNKAYMKPVHAANSYYRSVVSSIIYDNLNKNFELIRRIRNLDAAYQEVKQDLQKQSDEESKQGTDAGR